MGPRAVLAAVVLVLLVASTACTQGRSAAPTSAPSAKPAKPGGKLEVKHLPVGDPPRIPWLHDGVLHIGSNTVTLPKFTQRVAVTRKRIVTIGGSEVTVRDLAGKEQVTYGSYATGLAVNADRNIVAWVESDTPRIMQDGHPKELTLPKFDSAGKDGLVLAVTGHDCFHGPEETQGGGCSVYAHGADGWGRTFVSSNHGFSDTVGNDGDYVVDVSPQGRRLIALWGANGEPSCTKIVGEKTVHTCAYSPLGFSPTGKKVLGAPPDVPGDGPLISYGISMNDTKTGKTLATWTGDVWDWAWEDDSHALVLLTTNETDPNDDQWLIERVGLDGTKEIAVPPTGRVSKSDPYIEGLGFARQP